MNNIVLMSVVIPTYNESENITEVIERIHSSLDGISHEIIIVDDDSPDKTWEIANAIAKKCAYVRVIRRMSEWGLSRAVLEGFRQARGSILGVIDADLQHDERILPEMKEKIDAGAKIVVGSRYVPGGGVGGWSLARRLKSWIATKIAEFFLNVKIKDPMAGFFLIERALYEKIKNKVNPVGFKILLECLYHADASVVEVPYVFRIRSAGESKLSNKVVWDYLRQVIALRMQRPLPQGFLKYAAVGGLGVIVDMSVFYSCVKIFVPVICGLISGQVAIVVNFILNNTWTFSDRKRQNLGQSFIKYELACLPGVFFKISIIFLSIQLLRTHPLWGNFMGIIGATISNFVLSKLWVWKRERYRNE